MTRVAGRSKFGRDIRRVWLLMIYGGAGVNKIPLVIDADILAEALAQLGNSSPCL